MSVAFKGAPPVMAWPTLRPAILGMNQGALHNSGNRYPATAKGPRNRLAPEQTGKQAVFATSLLPCRSQGPLPCAVIFFGLAQS